VVPSSSEREEWVWGETGLVQCGSNETNAVQCGSNETNVVPVMRSARGSVDAVVILSSIELEEWLWEATGLVQCGSNENGVPVMRVEYESVDAPVVLSSSELDEWVWEQVALE
jgi:hypothetical protein